MGNQQSANGPNGAAAGGGGGVEPLPGSSGGGGGGGNTGSKSPYDYSGGGGGGGAAAGTTPKGGYNIPSPYGGGSGGSGSAGQHASSFAPSHGSTPSQQLPPNFQRSSSDASMTIVDIDGGAGSSNAGGSANASTIGTGNVNDWWDDDTVPTVFRWEHGGRNVYITGTFNGWSRQIPMHRSGNDFTYIHNLQRGKHAFKFIVDDEWRFAPDQPTVADIEGRINNFIDVTSFKPYTGDRDFEKEKAAAEYGYLEETTTSNNTSTTNRDTDLTEEPGGPDQDGEVFSHNMPDVYDYTKEPPPLPPHLRHIILNKPPQLQDTAALPVPQHVALNHLYCTAIRDNMMVLGITQRYKTKFVTTVYYAPCSSK
jgi:5'-AMP-activated protein kinase, regulatory beta subunit